MISYVVVTLLSIFYHKGLVQKKPDLSLPILIFSLLSDSKVKMMIFASYVILVTLKIQWDERKFTVTRFGSPVCQTCPIFCLFESAQLLFFLYIPVKFYWVCSKFATCEGAIRFGVSHYVVRGVSNFRNFFRRLPIFRIFEYFTAMMKHVYLWKNE